MTIITKHNNRQPSFEDLELLVEVSQLLTLLDIDAVIQKVIELTRAAVSAQKASLFLHDGLEVDWGHIFTARMLNSEESIRVVSRVLDKGLAGWVVRNRKAALVYDTRTDERWHVFPEDEITVGSAMCVPFMSDGEVVAVLTLVHKEPNHFSETQLRVITIVTNQAAIALRNAQLFNRLETQQRQLSAVLQSVPDLLFVMDEGGRLILMNSGAQSFLGIARVDEATGKQLISFIERDEIFTDIQQAMEEAARSDSPVSIDIRSERTKHDYTVIVSIWGEARGNRAGYVVLMHDVTQLLNLDRFKTEMLSIVSHDLRSPLANIAGYTDLIAFDNQHNPQLMDWIDVIRRQIDRMDHLLESLLAKKKVDENNLSLQRGVILSELAKRIAENMTVDGNRKNHIIVDEVRIDEHVTGMVDAMLLSRAMENFASNALKYTPEGGRIIIRTYSDNERFYLEVEDNGIGIPEDSLPRIFDEFYRVDSRANRAIHGVGIGLSLVKSIVERHEGAVWVNSQIGVGSLFGMWIPIEKK